MKVLSPDKIQQVDNLTIEREPIASIDLMERASLAFVKQFMMDYPDEKEVHIFCGPGNNGGDGLAISRLLNASGLEVHTYILEFTENFSIDHRINSSRLLTTAVKVHHVEHAGDLPNEDLSGFIIDAIFGSGLNKELHGLPAEVAQFINSTNCPVVAVDIASGVFAEKAVNGEAVKADMVYSFQLPKLAFLLPDNEAYIHEWKLVDIGLLPGAIDEMPTKHFFTTATDTAAIFKSSSKFAHKGTNGHAMILAGSKGKAGAAILAARAALRSGLGLLTMRIPSSLLDIMQESVPEAMCIADEGDSKSNEQDHLAICPSTKNYNSLGIGPGIGQEISTQKMLVELFNQYDRPMVIDADGLNILSADKSLLEALAPLSILTPHPGEFRRLAGIWENDFEKIQMQKDLSKQYNLIIVLKGAHTSISAPDGNLYFNSTGNPGMATAGSGDALTGIITGLLAQGYTSLDAAILGVYVHGLAGDLAIRKEHKNSMVASDIIDHIGMAFKKIDTSSQ